MDFEAGDQQNEDEQHLQPVPETFITGIQVNPVHLCSNHESVLLPAVAFGKYTPESMQADPEQSAQNGDPAQ